MTSREVINRDARRVTRVRPFLYVAGVNGLSPGVLARFGTVINLIPGFKLIGPSKLRVIHIPVEDDEGVDLTPYWMDVFKSIDIERKKRGKLLLLCAMGISRSATFAIGYLLCSEKMTLRDSYKHTQQCRNIICPNVGFFRQLIELEMKIFQRETVRMIEPVVGVVVADVVWEELFDDVIKEVNEEDRHALRSLKRSATERCVSISGSSSASSFSFPCSLNSVRRPKTDGDNISLLTNDTDRLSICSIP